MSVEEEETKKWLHIVKNWVDSEKLNPNILLFSTDDNISILQEYKEHEDNLCCYIKLLNDWIASNGITKALQEIPTVGKLFSQLCKIPIMRFNEQLSKHLINCMIGLSALTNPVINEIDRTTYQRAKNWTIDHLTTSTSMFVESVDLCLMEEFGISQEEYLTEQIKQVSIEISNWLDKPDANNFMIDDGCAVLNVIELGNQDVFLPIVEKFLHAAARISACTNGDSVFAPKCFDWITGSCFMNKLPASCLCCLFYLDHSSFESYVVSIVEKVVNAYPYVSEDYLEHIVTEFKLIELYSIDQKYYHGTIEVIKDSFRIIGLHPSLYGLLRTLIQQHQRRTSGFNKKTMLVSSLPEISKSLEKREESIQQFNKLLQEESLRQCTSEVKEIRSFTTWIEILQQGQMFEQFLLLLFDGQRQNVKMYLKLTLWYLHAGMTPEDQLQTLTSYVYALRNLQPKKHLQLCDLKYLLTSLRRNVAVDFSILLFVINILFFIKSSGAGSIMQEFLNSMFEDMNKDDVFYWLLYMAEVSMKRSLALNVSARETFSSMMLHLEPKLTLSGENEYNYDWLTLFHLKRCRKILNCLNGI